MSSVTVSSGHGMAAIQHKNTSAIQLAGCDQNILHILYVGHWWIDLDSKKRKKSNCPSVQEVTLCSVVLYVMKTQTLLSLKIFLVQVRLRTEVLRIPSSTRPGFEPMTFRSWQYIPCHWDACSNSSAVSQFVDNCLGAKWVTLNETLGTLRGSTDVCLHAWIISIQTYSPACVGGNA